MQGKLFTPTFIEQDITETEDFSEWNQVYVNYYSDI